MPKHKDLKRKVRARMQKTGEAYTTARLRLLEKKRAPSSTVVSKIDHAALAGMSDAAVRAGTGKSWSEWTAVLDAIDAASKPHREIARYVSEQHGTSSWWSQGVTVGYERIRSLRERGQRRGGGYEAHKSKTFGVPLARLYAAWAEARQRKRWLDGAKPVVRTARPEKAMRLTWEDGSSVELYFVAKGEAKSQVAIQHNKLATKADATRLKGYWAERLSALAELLR
jgi:hypothetical protein